MIKGILLQLRLHQWVKNLLLFIPVLLAHQLSDIAVLQTVALAVIAFSCIASAIYIVNDVSDLDADRSHPTKRNRPLAAGILRVREAMLMVPLLLAIGAWISIAWLPQSFVAYLGMYLAITTAYTFGLKRLVIIDVLTLSGLYTLRLLAGGAAAGVVVSPWLLMFSMFLFTSLAFVKRFTELLGLEHRNLRIAHGRGYVSDDLMMIRSIGPAIGFMAILVFAQYINSHEVGQLYSHSIRLWLAVPPIMYWIARVWMVANRREMHDDPIVFAMKDPVSYSVAVIVLIIALLAR